MLYNLKYTAMHWEFKCSYFPVNKALFYRNKNIYNFTAQQYARESVGVMKV